MLTALAVFALRAVGLNPLGRHVGVHLFPVRVVIGQGRMDLGQIQMRIFAGNLFHSHSRFVPDRNSADGDSRPGNAGPAAQMSGLCTINAPMSVSVAMVRPRGRRVAIPLFQDVLVALAKGRGGGVRIAFSITLSLMIVRLPRKASASSHHASATRRSGPISHRFRPTESCLRWRYECREGDQRKLEFVVLESHRLARWIVRLFATGLSRLSPSNPTFGSSGAKSMSKSPCS